MNALYKRIVTMGMISFTAILAWIYCILEYRSEPSYIVIVSLVVIASIYALLNAYINLKAEKDQKLQSYISETIQKSVTELNSNDNTEIERLNKATYVQIRRTNDILSHMAEESSKNSQQNLDSYIRITEEMNTLIADSINKAVKVIIKYSQNNNGDMVEAVNALSKGLDNIGNEIGKVKSEISNIEINVPAPNVTVAPMPQMVSADIVSSQAVSSTDSQSFETPVEDIITDNVSEATDNTQGATDQQDEPAPDLNAFFSEFGGDTAASDDSNKQLSPDEISALFEASKQERQAKSDDDFSIYDHPDSLDQGLIDALLGNIDEPDETEEHDENIADVIPFPTSQEAGDTATAEIDAVTEPVNDDPNRQLTPDEIAALFASASGNSEPVTEPEVAPEPVVEEAAPVNDDPNRQLTPDEIAALFASASGTSEPVAEPEATLEPVVEEAAPPVNDDPNRQLTPDEIAALFATMNA